jgi:hypothetical protein
MGEADNEARLRAILGAFNTNDIETATAGLHPSARHIIRGRAAVSGTFVGAEEIAEALRRLSDVPGDHVEAVMKRRIGAI